MMSASRARPGRRGSLASIAAMPKLRSILLATSLAAASAGVLGCGDGGPDPSISADTSASLLGKIQEIQSNVDNGSCIVAQDRTDDLISDIQELPSDVNEDVRRALENGANQLKILLADPDQCQGRTVSTTSTTTPSTPSTTATRTQSTTSTTRTQTQTTTPTQTTQTQTTPTNPSGGVGPGGTGGGP
jgi:hypothetical protein